MRQLYFYKNLVFYIFIFSFCISFISSKFLIKILTKHRFFQPNKNILLSLKKKQHYISMGGIAILFALNLSFFLLYLAGDKQNLGVLLLGNAYGLLGLIDDILKLSKKKSGLTIKARLIWETILAFIFIILISSPFINMQSLKHIVQIFWGVFIILATANAYNLTDGVDSLASTLGIYTLIFVYLFVPEAKTFALLLIFAILGHLVFNWPPAKLIMGDVGSLSIGGMIGALFYKYHIELFLPLVGFVFVIETLTCAIQIYYIRILNKRLFLMAPIHHHFEQKGWPKKKILISFNATGIATLICASIIKLYFK